MNRWETPWGLTSSQLLEKWKHVVDAGREIYTWTSDHELAFLCEAASRSSGICELGSYYGRSAFTMALASPTAHIDCFDICDHAEVESTFARNLAAPISDKRLRFYKGTSHLLQAIPVIYDLGWIDAGHTEKDVATDIANLLPKMRPQALLVGHDYRQNNPNDGVNLAIDAAFGKPQWVFQSVWAVLLP